VAVQLSDVLAGKIVVEISNPFNATYDDLVTDPTTSAGEEIQRRIPQGQVVKAFNTVFAPVCTEGELNGTQADVFLASDYEDAKHTVADLVRSCKLRPINAGALKNARILERWALLNVEITMRYNLNFRSGVKVIPLLLPTDRGEESTAEAKTK
jgi:predicted dinucleotide-binding enzyme